MPTYQLVIKGRVQGVFFRVSAKKIADKLGIKGWIKNTRNGSVETRISGNQEQVDEFVAWCRQGPEEAEVDECIILAMNDENFENYMILRN